MDTGDTITQAIRYINNFLIKMAKIAPRMRRIPVHRESPFFSGRYVPLTRRNVKDDTAKRVVRYDRLYWYRRSIGRSMYNSRMPAASLSVGIQGPLVGV